MWQLLVTLKPHNNPAFCEESPLPKTEENDGVMSHRWLEKVEMALSHYKVISDLYIQAHHASDRSADASNVRDLSLAARLQHFSGRIRIELPDASPGALQLRIAVKGTSYLVRYQVESLGAEVSVYNNAGSITSWITNADGQHVQLRTFLSDRYALPAECRHITALIDILEILDLFDIFRASIMALQVPTSPTSPTASNHDGIATSPIQIYHATSDKNAYIFVFDQATGCPLTVTQSTLMAHQARIDKLRVVVEEYVRLDASNSSATSFQVPAGIKSDVELMVDTAMTCFSQWSYSAQQHMQHIFDVIDSDNDGFVSGDDVYAQLLAVEHSEPQASRIVTEMTRLLCDAGADPSEEISFYKFMGFWLTMLCDGFHVSDPANERTVVAAFQQLFLGE